MADAHADVYRDADRDSNGTTDMDAAGNLHAISDTDAASNAYGDSSSDPHAYLATDTATALRGVPRDRLRHGGAMRRGISLAGIVVCLLMPAIGWGAADGRAAFTGAV